VIFALVVFPILFMIGVPFSEPLLGDPIPGSPAWRAELPAGTRVLSVNGNRVHDFGHIPNEVALGSPEETLLVVQEPGADAPRTVRLEPEYSQRDGFYTIGVTPSAALDGSIVVAPDSPAAAAGLRSGDQLVSIEGLPDGLSTETELYLATRDGQPFTARFRRGDEFLEATLATEAVPPTGKRQLGVAPPTDRVAGVRDTPATRALGLAEGDLVLAVGGQPIRRPGDLLLALDTLARETGGEGARAAAFEVERDGKRLTLQATLASRAAALALADDVALAQDVDDTRVVVTPDSPGWHAGLRDGDRLVRVGGAEVETFKDISDAIKAGSDGDPLALSVLRTAEGAQEVLELSAEPGAIAGLTYGLGLEPARYIFRTNGPIEAVRVGFSSSWKFMKEAWLALKRILLGQVRADNVGGIVTIGVVSHSWAALGLAKLFFFLCMLSMNLAFLNVLPIPVLDGGHLFFLIIEKIKGSPVSERVLGYSQIVGLVLIVSLMVFVTYNDLVRWVFPSN
jgi:regulator of sigma E protease